MSLQGRGGILPLLLLGTREGQTQEHVRMQPNHMYVSLKPVPHEKVGCPSRNMAFCTRYSYSLLIVACLERLLSCSLQQPSLGSPPHVSDRHRI